MSPPLMILLGLFIAALVAWAAWAWRRERSRRGQFVRAGDRQGLRFDANDPFDLPESCFQLYLFTRGHNRFAYNVLHGRLAGRPVRLFDYQYETGSGRNRRTHGWQVALIHTDLDWPGLLCQPLADYDPLEAVFGLVGVPFQVEPFAGQFHVACENPDFAYQFLHPRLIDLLLAEPRATLEARGEAVAMYRRAGCRLPPAEAVALLELAGKVVGSLPETLSREMVIGDAPSAR